MGKEAKQWAKRKRVELIMELGGVCRHCDEEFDEENPQELTIDHIDGRDWNIRKLGSDSRVARYWREYNLSVQTGVPVLQVLCVSCNTIKQRADMRDGFQDEPKDDGPQDTPEEEYEYEPESAPVEDMHQSFDVSDTGDPF